MLCTVQCTLRVWDATTDAGWLMLCHRIIRSSASLLSPSMCISEWFCCYLFCRSWAEARNDIKMQTRYNKYVYICQCKIYLPYNNMDSFSLSLFLVYRHDRVYTSIIFYHIINANTRIGDFHYGSLQSSPMLKQTRAPPFPFCHFAFSTNLWP